MLFCFQVFIFQSILRLLGITDLNNLDLFYWTTCLTCMSLGCVFRTFLLRFYLWLKSDMNFLKKKNYKKKRTTLCFNSQLFLILIKILSPFKTLCASSSQILLWMLAPIWMCVFLKEELLVNKLNYPSCSEGLHESEETADFKPRSCFNFVKGIEIGSCKHYFFKYATKCVILKKFYVQFRSK